MWYSKILKPEMKQAFVKLKDSGLIKSFYLGGGTALALQIGHRESIDLDFFCEQHFNEDEIIEKLSKLEGFQLHDKDDYTVHGNIEKSKVSFLGYKYPLVFPLQEFNNIAIADIRDVACMKLTAIAGRGSKRDFVDIFTVSQVYPLPVLFEAFKEKFSKVSYSENHVIRSLTYFEDAEKEVMPRMLKKVSWDKVKEFFIQEASKLR